MKKGLTGLFVALVVFFTAQGSLVGAQGTGNGQGGNGLSITPTRFEFVIERGKAETANIQIKNVTDKPILARAFLNDFEPEGNTGNPRLIIDSQEQSSSSIREFVIGLQDVNVGPGETVPVDLPIQIPDNAAPGAYYGAVRFQAAAPETDGDANNPQVALNASVAALVLIEVPGDITEKIEITNISAYLEDKKGVLFTKKPNNTGIEVNNLGNGFSKPFGRVSITGPWGKGEVNSYELNNTSPRGNVLPRSSRLFKNDIGGISLPGRYTIQANISHGRGGEVLTATTSFWYIPVWMIAVLAIVLLGLVGVAYYLFRKYGTKTKKRR